MIKKCKHCNRDFKSLEKYCSKICKSKDQIITKRKILYEIRDFYKKAGRIPFKNEFLHYKAARNHFGTWNMAIIAAGLEPNPVKFSKKHIANDGHKCDSLAEKIIDDWLYSKKILHERNIPYGKNNMTADFKVNGIIIEFFGLNGKLKTYDEHVKQKIALWKKNRLKATAIYPKDLFPRNRLAEVLKL